MELSGPFLEAAAHSMYHGTLSQQQEAVNLFSTWQNSNNALITAARLLSADSSESLQFVTCCVILYASDQWFKYDRIVLDEIRHIIFQFTFAKVHQNLINAKLDEIIAKMAFNDWPDHWPEFISQMIDLIRSEDSNSQIHVFMALANFLKMIYNSPKITLRRRAMMIQLFISNVPEMISLVDQGEHPPGVAHAFLEFSDAMCQILSNDDSMTISFSQYLFTTFVPIDAYAPKALTSISRLFSPSTYLTHLVPLMAEFIRNRLQNEVQEFVFPIAFQEFICMFLHKFLDIADTFCTSDEVASPIQKLFQVCLTSAPRNIYIKQFWDFWSSCLEKIANNTLNSIRLLISPLLNIILSTFYELLPCSAQLSRLISPSVASAFTFLVKIAPQDTLSFITSQPSTLSLCYAIGIIQDDSLKPKLQQIIEECSTSTDLSVISAVLYAISRNTNILKNEPSLIGVLQNMSYSGLFATSDSDYQTSVLLALNHVASTFPNALTSSQQFIDLLFNCASPERLQPDDFARLCRILAKVIMTTPQNVRSQYITDLTNIANVRLTSPDSQTVAIGVQAAWAISSISLCGSYLITRFLWKPLLAAMTKAKDDECCSDIVAVFASSVRSAPWGQCFKVCFKFIQIAQTIVPVAGNDTSVLDAYNMMYQCHHELAEFRDIFADSFVQRMADCPQSSFFEFFKFAGLKEHEQPVVVGAACQSIKDLDLNVSRAAASLLKTLANRQKDPRFLEKWQPYIIRAVFAALFDDLHNTLIQPIAKVLFAIYKRHAKNVIKQSNSSVSMMMTTTIPTIDQVVVEAIAEEVGDQGVTMSFATALRNAANLWDEFVQLINDFLISFGRFNPLEIKLFDDSLTVRALTSDFGNTQINNSVAVVQNEDEYATLLS